MAAPDFAPPALFDLAGLPFRDLFDGVDRAWDALGVLERWLADNLVPGNSGHVHGGAVVEGAVQVGPGTVIEPGAYVQGPCWIGSNVQVRHGAYIRGHALIGDGAVVGHATEVKASIFLPGARAGHFAYVGDSILGRDVNLGAGTKLANLRLAADEVVIRAGGASVPTGLRKLGAILGDKVQTGCNSVTNPGTVLGPGALVHPCLAVSGYHPGGSILR